MKICPVILCGGIGSRLWPASQESLPKQFLKFNNKHSLFQNTILRINNSDLFSKPIIICSDKYKFRTASELEEINIAPLSIITEPTQKNTTPAITLAVKFIEKYHPELKKVLVLSSDHLIDDNVKFVQYISQLNKVDTANLIVTLGIKPQNPATGYGYIKLGKKMNSNLFHVDQFIEKPSQEIASKLLEDKNNFWNSGIFFFHYPTLINEVRTYKPDILQHISNAIEHIKSDKYFFNIDPQYFNKCENISIDYAILEHTKNAAIMPIDINWNDLGTWKSVYDVTPKDNDSNAILGKKIYTKNSENCLIYSNNPHINIVAHRIKDLNISITDNIVLISNNNYPEEIKEIYNSLKDIPDIKEPSLEYRPWGYYKNIFITEHYKVKLLSINPNSQISLQYHHNRAEHWIITKGTATITIGDNIHTLERDHSIYVPKTEIHKIENKTNTVLEIIEVQIGNYLGEDDIVRLEDKYNRV